MTMDIVNGVLPLSFILCSTEDSLQHIPVVIPPVTTKAVHFRRAYSVLVYPSLLLFYVLAV
jgi:hypothetical protein